MKKKKLIIITTGIIAVMAVIAIIVISSINDKFIYNADTVAGNTAGNLNNGGLFCEYEGKIYFANPSDSNRLYRMNSDCTEPERLNTDCVAFINTDGNHLYYVKNNYETTDLAVLFRGHLFGVYRTDMKGGKTKVLYDKLTGSMVLCGNYLYYQHYDGVNDSCLYKMKIDGKENTKFSSLYFNPTCAYNGNVYVSNVEGDHNILKLSNTGVATSIYYYANSYLPVIQDNSIFYIDLSDKYSLKRYSLSNGTLELVSDKRCINYNIIGSKVYYITEGNDAGLYRCNFDGSDTELVAKGAIGGVHCTSQYTFFTYYNDSTLYRVPSVGQIYGISQIDIK
ncbi:MAG: DUF5050 domain-containing protein [Lachnospiraceae bacterium]